MPRERKLIISACGENSRIRDFMRSNFGGAPKPILPLSTDDGNIIQKIIRDAFPFFHRVDLHVSDNNAVQLQEAVKEFPAVNVRKSNNDCFLRSAQLEYDNISRVYFASADFFCNLDWRSFEEFHDSHNVPISCVASRGAENVSSSVVKIHGHMATEWQRKLTDKNDLQNIGMYICDPHPELRSFFSMLTAQSDAKFEKAMVEKGLLACFHADCGFNVNDEITYRALIESIGSR